MFHLTYLQEKNRKRGRNKISAKLRRRQKNVVDEQVMKFRAMKKAAVESEKAAQDTNNAGSALSRFVRAGN